MKLKIIKIISFTYLNFRASTYVGFPYLEQLVFGTYSLRSIDLRGNNIYHAYHEFDVFISKDMENSWIVSVTILLISKRIM